MSTVDTTHAETPQSREAEALEGLGIHSRHPLAIKHALEWSTLMRYLAAGADIQTSARKARIPRPTLYDWLNRGRGTGPYKRPAEPFDEFAAAFDEARATGPADCWVALMENAIAGDTRAAQIIIERRDAQRTAAERSRESQLKCRLLEEQIRATKLRNDGQLPPEKVEHSGSLVDEIARRIARIAESGRSG